MSVSGIRITRKPVRGKPLPKEIVTKIKPSEAIRLGRFSAPRVIAGRFESGDGACTLGAMFLGWGGRKNSTQIKEYYDGKIPEYVLQKIMNIPATMDGRVFNGHEAPEVVEASLIKSLEAMGW